MKARQLNAHRTILMMATHGDSRIQPADLPTDTLAGGAGTKQETGSQQSAESRLVLLSADPSPLMAAKTLKKVMPKSVKTTALSDQAAPSSEFVEEHAPMSSHRSHPRCGGSLRRQLAPARRLRGGLLATT